MMQNQIEPFAVNDTFPNHNVGNNIYIKKNGLEKRIVKIGDVQSIEKEYNALCCLESIVAKKNDRIKFKTPHAFCIYSYAGKKALEMSYEGKHTLEFYLHNRSRNIIFADVSEMLNSIRDSNILWYAASPKNIMVRQVDAYTMLDWEHGIRYINDDQEGDYKRAIELREEWVSFDECLLPYWSQRWPSINELFCSRKAIMCNFDLSQVKSRRIKYLSTLCEINSIISDAEYFRMMFVLSSLYNDSKKGSCRLIFVADHLSEYGFSELRVKCSIIAWFLRITNTTLLNRLFYILIKAYILGEKKIFDGISICEQEINSMMESLYGDLWFNQLLDNCKRFIINGQSIDRDKEYIVMSYV